MPETLLQCRKICPLLAAQRSPELRTLPEKTCLLLRSTSVQTGQLRTEIGSKSCGLATEAGLESGLLSEHAETLRCQLPTGSSA